MFQYLVFFWGGGTDLSKQALQYCIDGRNVVMKKKSLEISKKIVSCTQQKKKISSLTSLALEFL
jgi:hypothetical protein